MPTSTSSAVDTSHPAARGAKLCAGRRVYLRPPVTDDREEFLCVVRASRRLHRPWISPPSTDAAFDAYIERTASHDFCGLLVCRNEGDAIVGLFNISQIFYGGFQSAYLGYWAATEFVGCGYMTEAMGLVLKHAFTTLNLHRLEANIQPGNERSIALVARCGFRKEGYSPRYLKVFGRWRDHERWAICKEDWKQFRRRSKNGK